MRVSVKHLTMNQHLQTVPMEPALPMQEIWGDIQGHQYSQFHIKAFISKVIHFTVERLEPIQEKKSVISPFRDGYSQYLVYILFDLSVSITHCIYKCQEKKHKF